VTTTGVDAAPESNEPQDAGVPFNRPALVGNELTYVREAIAKMHLSGAGEFTRRCESELSRILGGSRVLLTTSCTHALEMSALLLDIQPGDEVIVPSFTFPSTANAFVLRGAVPIFADVRPDTLNLDEAALAAAITARTRAIVPVHYAGVACEMDAILRLARRAGVAVVEDNAHGLFGLYRGQPLGTFGSMSALSFHETKNVQCGEGGALVLNDATLIERAEVLREKGTDRSRFFRGEVDRYTWIDVGSSYVPSDMLAAFLLGQLERSREVQEARRRLWSRYASDLAAWAKSRSVHLPIVPPDASTAYHLFHLVMADAEQRDAFLAHLRAHGVHAIFHYLPLHLSAMGKKFGGRPGQCPVSESVSERLVRLPLFAALTDVEQDRVINAILRF
jgi:dTDP-4-amino-4,6-dideoxygalactose transaminase